jgi:16S rRNA (cytosine1402-N4)-methyltransferase
MTPTLHIPVMPAEVVEHLDVRPNGLYVDCTFGGGGHASMVCVGARWERPGH